MSDGAAFTAHDAQLVPLSSLKPYKDNPRKGDVTAIRESLRVNGQFRPVVVRVKTREVLAGNHTLAAAHAEGWDQIWATFIDCDAKTAKRIVLVDNRSNDLASYDDEALAGLLGSLPELDGTGYSQKDLDKLVGALGADPIDTGPALGAVEYRLLIECDGEEHQAQLLERFEAEGLRVQAIAQ